MSTVKGIVEDVLSVPKTKKLWTSVYKEAIYFTPQVFSMEAVLPAVFYMFRWGHRRGKGNFVKTFGKEIGSKTEDPSIEDVTVQMLKNHQWFEGFDGEAGKAVFGDMLLSFCLENKKNKMGRTEKVQRVFPTHYLASWIDLPESIAHLRHIPEMLVSILANQKEGEFIQKNHKKNHFPVAADFKENVMLKLFGKAMEIRGPYQTDITKDIFLETTDEARLVGIDQLLTTRMAQSCGSAPFKAKGGGESERIPNQHPLAGIATRALREDLNVFIQSYGETIPRQTFLQMFESCMSLGLTNIYFSTASILLSWEKTGILLKPHEQRPWPLFVDCSCGSDQKLRRLAEESMSDCLRLFERLPVVMMCLRVLEETIRYDRKIKDDLPASSPDAVEFINYLGSFMTESHPYSERIFDNVAEICLRLAEALQKDEPIGHEHLRLGGNPVVRLAESLCILMGNKLQIANYIKALDSCFMVDRPHGLARKRKVSRKNAAGQKSLTDARSIVLTNTMLDFLVHRHLRRAAKGKGSASLPFVNFLRIMRERYGLYVDVEPEGLSIPVELLQRNREILERRLRDLGVLIGVNDAEAMNRLRQRFPAKGDGIDNDNMAD